MTYRVVEKWIYEIEADSEDEAVEKMAYREPLEIEPLDIYIEEIECIEE